MMSSYLPQVENEELRTKYVTKEEKSLSGEG
jgi:hypothetical protein